MGTALNLSLLVCLSVVSLITAETYSVKIITEQHVNEVDSRFLSFTIDPKYLFSTNEKYSSKECTCMASVLSPAYLRIAGPSTVHMSFQNTTISIEDQDLETQSDDVEVVALDEDTPRKVPLEVMPKKLEVSLRQWRKFIQWAKSTGFDLVFALNNEERTASNMWDPNTALNILTVAEKTKVGEMFWQLGYECNNQSIEEYLNDLETLRVIIETFTPGSQGEWRVVGGDVTKCLQADSKSDFKDYITLSNSMMDALLLNGNSSAHELERMSESDRSQLLHLIFSSTTPLWLTEHQQRRYNQLERAADWLASLGYSANNGFSVHYRELDEEEMYEPTLSFYMALLYKNLVGERVLNVQMTPKQAILFGHCTSLRHKPVPGAVTLFGVNMDEEPARFSLKLPEKEDGGDIMQYILGFDHSGNIVVNGRAMYYEGDIRPVVKRMRPYKTLLITLPAKSFGFWVLANTKIKACQGLDEANNTFIGTETDNIREKRSADDDFEDYNYEEDISNDFDDSDPTSILSNALKGRIIDINAGLDKIRSVLKLDKSLFRLKRENRNYGNKIQRKKTLRSKLNRLDLDLDPKVLIHDILRKAKESVDDIKQNGIRKVTGRLNRNKVSKRHSKNSRFKNIKLPLRYLRGKDVYRRKNVNKVADPMPNLLQKNAKYPKYDTPLKSTVKNPKLKQDSTKTDVVEEKLRRKSSMENKILNEDADILLPKTRRRRQANTEKTSIENEIKNFDEEDKAKFWKILKQIREDMKDFSDDNQDDVSEESIILKTKISDDAATIKVQDSGKGLIKSTLNNLVNVLEDLNGNLNKFWGALSVLG